MPKCAKCYNFFPPEFCVDIIVATDGSVQCIFCDKQITEITRTLQDGRKTKYTKKECVEDYKKLMRMIKEKVISAKQLIDGDLPDGAGPKTDMILNEQKKITGPKGYVKTGT